MDILKAHFPRLILQNQDVLGEKETWSKILALIPDEDIRTHLDRHWQQSHDTPKEKWTQLVQETQVDAGPRKRALLNAARDIIFQYTYPRLDDKVTTGVNHLLKSPFCVHPKTGRISVPINPDTCDRFDPFSVPKLSELIEEIDAFDAEHGKDSGVSDVDKTSLKPYMKLFEHFVRGLEQEQKNVPTTARPQDRLDW